MLYKLLSRQNAIYFIIFSFAVQITLFQNPCAETSKPTPVA